MSNKPANLPTAKTCPQCQAGFACGVGGSKACWCDELPSIMPLEEGGACLCPACLKKKVQQKIDQMLAEKGAEAEFRKQVRGMSKTGTMVEGIDYYLNEQGNWVFTTWFHLQRGSCCKNACLHCPYGFKKKKA